MGRYRLLAGVLALSLGTFVFAPAAGAVPNPGAGAGTSGDACIYWSPPPSQNAGLCVSVGTGAGVGVSPGPAGTYSQGFYHWWDGANDDEGVFNPADFHEDPTGTSATLDTTVNGCRLTMSLNAAPATPIDGIWPYEYDYVYPYYGHVVGVGWGRELPASGPGSVCNDAFDQGLGSWAWIDRGGGVGAVENQ